MDVMTFVNHVLGDHVLTDGNILVWTPDRTDYLDFSYDTGTIIFLRIFITSKAYTNHYYLLYILYSVHKSRYSNVLVKDCVALLAACCRYLQICLPMQKCRHIYKLKNILAYSQRSVS